MNKVMLVGRIVHTPEVKYSQSANPVAVCNFSLAVRRPFAKQGDKDVDFVNCTVFGKTAENLVKYTGKGVQIAISGRLEVNTREKDGEKKTYTKVIVEDITFIGNKSDKVESESQCKEDAFTPAMEDDDDLPF